MPVRIEQLTRKDRLGRLVVLVGIVVLVVFGIKYLVENRWDLLWQVIASIIALVLLLIFGKRFNQGLASHLAMTFLLVMHNLDLYSTHPLGIRFDHYTHFLGGFTVALITDRFFTEKLGRAKRFVILLMAALGVGTIWEIFQWLDAYIFPGFEMFQADSISNTIKDIICNGLGGITMGIISLFRKQ